MDASTASTIAAEGLWPSPAARPNMAWQTAQVLQHPAACGYAVLGLRPAGAEQHRRGQNARGRPLGLARQRGGAGNDLCRAGRGGEGGGGAAVGTGACQGCGQVAHAACSPGIAAPAALHSAAPCPARSAPMSSVVMDAWRVRLYVSVSCTGRGGGGAGGVSGGAGGGHRHGGHALWCPVWKPCSPAARQPCSPAGLESIRSQPANA